VAAHKLQRRALTRARRTLTAVGARFVVGRVVAALATFCPHLNYEPCSHPKFRTPVLACTAT
jgi:predicted Holliday junction resolvase-like endonuclease